MLRLMGREIRRNYNDSVSFATRIIASQFIYAHFAEVAVDYSSRMLGLKWISIGLSLQIQLSFNIVLTSFYQRTDLAKINGRGILTRGTVSTPLLHPHYGPGTFNR